MKSLLWSLLCFFSSFALACPTPPAYYNQDVCQFVQEHSTSFKTDILRIQLKAHAIRRKQTMDLTEQCQIKLAYTVCGARFVGQELAENIFFNGDTNQIQELIKRSKKYIASNSDWMKRLIEKESFGNDHKADEIRVILYEENLLPKETNLFKFTNNFQDKSKIPTGLRSLLEQHQSIEKRFWDPEFDKSLNSGSGTDWVAVFKRNPELAKKIQEEIDMLPFEERKFQTFRLETVKKSPPKQRKARMDFLQQKLTTLNQNNGWPTSESDQFQRTLAETSPLTNSEAISLMKTMVEKKQSNNFPETIFWKLFNEIQDEGLTNPDREDLMMILYQMDNTAWAKKALSSLSTMDEFISDKLKNGCEIEPEKMRAYFSDAYKKFREKNTSQIHAKLKDPSMNPTEALALLTQEFDPMLKVNDKNFLDLMVELPLANFTSEQVLEMIKVGCGKFNCIPLLELQRPSPIGRSIEANRPIILKGFLDYLRLRRHTYSKENRDYLRKLNKNSSNSKEIRKVIDQADWI